MTGARLTVTCLLAVAVAAGCGSDNEDDPTITAPSTSPTSSTASSPPSGTASEEATTLRAGDFSFTPRTLTVRSGAVISLSNTGRAGHTWTSKPGQPLSFDIGLSEPGATASFTATRPGTYEFVCSIHEGRGMTGTLVVTA